VEKNLLDLSRLFNPRSIAIVGASSRQSSISGQFLTFLTRFGYSGQIYPINPSHQKIDGRPCYKRLIEIPGDVDLCLVLTPKQAVQGTIIDCVKKGVSYAVIPAAGFGETGADGARLQEELMHAARAGGMRVLGPNCMGFISFRDNVVASFGGFLADVSLARGNVAFVSQSGAFGGSMVRRCLKQGFGFTYHVSTGNEADLNSLDFIEYYLSDPETRVIGAFIESVRDAGRFIALGRRARDLGKMIVVLKGGKSARGAQAVSSHTGRIAGSAEVYRGLFAQAGVIEVNTAAELSSALETFSQVKTYPPSCSVAAVVASGGSGILASDHCDALGISLPELSATSQAALSPLIPEAGSYRNPVDVTAQVPHNELEKLASIIDVVCSEEGIGVLLLSISNVHLEKCWRQVLERVEAAGKFLAVGSSGGLSESTKRELGQTGRVVIGEDIWDAVERVSFLNRREKLLRNKQTLIPAASCNRHNSHILPRPAETELTEYRAKQLLAPFIPLPRGALAGTLEEALSIASEVGYPVVLKLMASGLVHKTEVGAVKLRIGSPESLTRAYHELTSKKLTTARRVEGVLVEQEVPSGTEVVLGLIRKPDLGPLVTFGSGGILVELLRDVSYRSLPASDEDLSSMVRETLCYKLLQGFRNQAAADLDSLFDLIRESGAIFLANPWMKELEFNPVSILPKNQGGVRILDVALSVPQDTD
jgi:acyl-CoA synthetase (NDP forming)